MCKDIIPGRLWRAIRAMRGFAGDERLCAGSERLSATGNMRHDIILLTRHQVFICEYSNGGERLRRPPLNHGKHSNERAVGLSYALVEMLLEAGKYPADFFGPT